VRIAAEVISCSGGFCSACWSDTAEQKAFWVLMTAELDGRFLQINSRLVRIRWFCDPSQFSARLAKWKLAFRHWGMNFRFEFSHRFGMSRSMSPARRHWPDPASISPRVVMK